MTTIVTRLYATAEKADAAAASLRKAGFTSLPLGVVKPGGKGDAGLAAIRALGVYEAAAKTYADRVKGGDSLVVVHAPFGKSYRAMEFMDAHEPINANVRYTEVYVPAKDPPNWTEKQRYLPILSNSDTLVLSDGLMPPAVIRNHRPMNSVISNNKPKARLISGTFSDKFGIPLLTEWRASKGKLLKTGTPFSTALGMPTLTDR
jgi:hypothetical protein